MEIGKLPNEVLEKIVLDNIDNKRDEVIIHAGIGKDCAVIDFGEKGCIVSSDPITGATKNIGSLAITISCNDVAASGGEPVGVLLTMLVPSTMTLEDIEGIMKEAGKTAKELNVEIIGGHTEVTDVVNKLVLVTTVIGMQEKDKIMGMKKVNIGDKVLMTKYAGIEGTSIIGYDLEEKLRGNISEDLIEEAKSLSKEISVLKEGRVCSDMGAKYMHDITEGGLLGAVWESSKGNGVGIKIYEERIPIKKSTAEICKFLDINPLSLISSGSLIVIIEEDKADELIAALEKKGILGTVLGEVIEGDDLLMDSYGQISHIESPGSDEIYKVI